MMGWYKNDRIHGNYMSLDTKNNIVRKKGWYEHGQLVDDMKDHPEFLPFEVF